MQSLLPIRRLQLTILGLIYYYAYVTNRRRFLGVKLSNWLKQAALALFLLFWVFRLPGIVVLLALFLAIWVRYVYWRAYRAGYCRFVPDKTADSGNSNLTPLPPNQRIKMGATGVFSLHNREDTVLLRPAEYWTTPLGEHVVMVQQFPGQYLYQFFNSQTLEAVQTGWLVFGKEPLPALAVTFCVKWGPDFNDLTQLYYVPGDEKESECVRRTIYFTFASETDQALVRQTIAQDISYS